LLFENEAVMLLNEQEERECLRKREREKGESREGSNRDRERNVF
jgi:hypothetical protein